MKKTTLSALLFGLLSAGTVTAAPFSISMVADNDFAIFSGTATSINNLLYQNNVDWMQQIPALSTLNFNLAPGDNMFYVLAMGGGGAEENISGVVNGVNMTDPSVSVVMSSNLASYLTGYPINVAAGTYNASLSEVQAAFPNLSWGAPVLNTTQTVIQAAGFGKGYTFATNTAHLFRFEASDVGVTPEPATVAVLGLALAGLALHTRRRKLAA